MRKQYDAFCKIEEIITGVFLCAITGLVFVSAVARTLRHPVNWAQDVSLLLFAWVVFFGADVALREADFINVDIFIKKIPERIQTLLYYLWNLVIILFLGALIRFGIPLSIENSKRLFQALGISYSWASISVPVCSALMIVTTALKLVARYRQDREKARVG